MIIQLTTTTVKTSTKQNGFLYKHWETRRNGQKKKKREQRLFRGKFFLRMFVSSHQSWDFFLMIEQSTPIIYIWDFLSLLIFDDYRDDCLLLFFISFLYKKMSNEKNPESMNSESSSIIIDNWRKRILLPIHLSECQLRHMNKGFSDS